MPHRLRIKSCWDGEALALQLLPEGLDFRVPVLCDLHACGLLHLVDTIREGHGVVRQVPGCHCVLDSIREEGGAKKSPC